jgi:alkylhydroperoxidase family enzyme
MARIPYIDPAALPLGQRDLVPADINFLRAFANSREAVRRYRSLTKFLREEGSLDARLREMALIQIGYSLKCAYEYTHHIKIGMRYGVSADDVRAIAGESAGHPTGLDPLTKAVLDATRQLALGFDLSDETFEKLRAGLDEEQIMELFFSIATWTGTVQMFNAIKVDLEPEYERYLVDFPIGKQHA